jgi:Domain of unknown function (DUF6429)
MDYDKHKVDEMTLALLYLVMHGTKGDERAWKGFDWETMNRLHEKGYIRDPRSKAKSVALTAAGARLSVDLFHKHFSMKEA